MLPVAPPVMSPGKPNLYATSGGSPPVPHVEAAHSAFHDVVTPSPEKYLVSEDQRPAHSCVLSIVSHGPARALLPYTGLRSAATASRVEGRFSEATVQTADGIRRIGSFGAHAAQNWSRHLYIRMGRRQAPEKKRRVHSSPEPVRAALPSSPVHNVSASGSQNNAERDHELEPLSGNLPNVILLSMLEQLEAKLDNLQNTLKDIPSRVAVLMEQIWLTKGQYHLENGGASLEMVSPVTVGDCSFSKFPPTPLSVMAREGNQYLQPTPPHGCEPEQSQCLQPMSLDGCELQEDCTVSRCSPPDVLVIPGEPSLRLLPVIDGGQEPQEDQCTQLEPEEHVKKEQLYADSWNPQQRFCLQPPFYERREPQQNHFRQPVLPDGKGPDEHIKQELLWIDGDGPQLNHCRQPAFEECQSLQNNTWLEQVLSDENEPHQNCKTEPMHPEDCGQYCDLQQPCTDAQGASVSSSFLEQNTAGTDGTISTDPLERGNMESDVLLFKSIPAQQSQTECMNVSAIGSKDPLKAQTEATYQHENREQVEQ
ncbi:hypothetical protein NDU88_000970 [Pleurodeles waltl]|uniref:Uncharacterized protein n=1 Tax=Pleurodeles waltl TaxID=8319 RepID=A0AAV7SY80_PLEWA|nr:hypothetical protein NDU88_000970 [Pleurodeles waltl]